MTNDFYENISSTSQHFEEIEPTSEIYENPVTSLGKSNHINEDVNNNEVRDETSLSSFYSILEEYLSANNSHEISINLNEWFVFDLAMQKSRRPRQHEFLLLLLEKPQYSSCVSWVNKDQGLCQIHEPEQVAKIWGKVKNRCTTGLMNYNTFARGIRHYYKSGLMIKTHKKHILRFKVPFNSILQEKNNNFSISFSN